MTEIRTTLEGFQMILEIAGNIVFESEEVIVTTYNGVIVIAEKENKNKLYKNSLPIVSLGVSGVASWDLTLMKEEEKLCKKCGKQSQQKEGTK